MTTLADYGITLTYDEPTTGINAETKTVLLKGAGHKEAMKLAIDTVTKLRQDGIMDAIEIWPREDEEGVITYTVLRCRR